MINSNEVLKIFPMNILLGVGGVVGAGVTGVVGLGVGDVGLGGVGSFGLQKSVFGSAILIDARSLTRV